MTAWQSFVHLGDLIFDVGAGDGQTTRALLARGARVVSVEAHPERARRLRELSGSAVVVDRGLANRAGGMPTDAGPTIQLTTLDELIRGFGVPHYCRLDVGGDPASILAGLSTPVIPLLSFE